ncbi:MAG TPA: DUF3795 domain-containing protein [Opitutales bacterium]|nr:DUF3795 domain-containing protein [Opitutales bacterium]
MNESDPVREDLIAPCGLDCALCSRHLAFVNHLKRSQCPGCRAKKEPCGYLFEKCRGINHGRSCADAVFCDECPEYPCREIDRVDRRYQLDYGASPRENLSCIRSDGMAAFLEKEAQRHRCPRCGAMVSVHNGKCFACDTITRLVEKRPKNKTTRPEL